MSDRDRAERGGLSAIYSPQSFRTDVTRDGKPLGSYEHFGRPGSGYLVRIAPEGRQVNCYDSDEALRLLGATPEEIAERNRPRSRGAAARSAR